MLDGTLLQSTGCPSSGNESTLRHVGDCCLWTTALYLLKNWEVKVMDASARKERKGSSHVNIYLEKWILFIHLFHGFFVVLPKLNFSQGVTKCMFLIIWVLDFRPEVSRSPKGAEYLQLQLMSIASVLWPCYELIRTKYIESQISDALSWTARMSYFCPATFSQRDYIYTALCWDHNCWLSPHRNVLRRVSLTDQRIRLQVWSKVLTPH